MIPMRRTRLILALLSVAALTTGCSTLGRLNPFGKSQPKGEVASEGERIAIVASGQKLEVADALKGVDFFLPEPAPVADWPLPGGTPEQAHENIQAGANLGVDWKRGFGVGSKRGTHVTAPPVMAAGRVFVMDGEATISAFDAASGAPVWRTDVRPPSKRDKEAFGGGVAYSGGKLYVSTGYRQVVQLDAATGAVGWRAPTDSPVHAAPTVSGGRVMVVAVDNTLLTFDAATGAPGWTYQALSEPARILAASSVAVSGDTAVASFGSGELVALRIGNGNDLWNEALSQASRNNALSEIRDIPGRPVIYQGDVFAVSHSGVFAATDLRTGAPRWNLPVTGITTPWPVGDVVYVVSKSGEVICAARDTGLIYWIRDLNAGRARVKKTRFLGVSFGRGKAVIKPLWSSPVLVSGKLIVGSSTGEVVAINAKTGVVERTVNVGGPVLIGPIAAGGTVYIATDEAQLVALR